MRKLLKEEKKKTGYNSLWLSLGAFGYAAITSFAKGDFVFLEMPASFAIPAIFIIILLLWAMIYSFMALLKKISWR